MSDEPRKRRTAEHLRPHWFKPGQSGSPGGKRRIDPELRAAYDRISADNLARLLGKYWAMPRNQIEELAQDPYALGGEALIAVTMAKTFKDGELGRMKDIFDRTMGKPKDSGAGENLNVTALAISELLTLAAEAIQTLQAQEIQEPQIAQFASADEADGLD